MFLPCLSLRVHVKSLKGVNDYAITIESEKLSELLKANAILIAIKSYLSESCYIFLKENSTNSRF